VLSRPRVDRATAQSHILQVIGHGSFARLQSGTQARPRRDTSACKFRGCPEPQCEISMRIWDAGIGLAAEDIYWLDPEDSSVRPI